VGGLGLGFGDAARAVEQIARECASTAMVLTMHYAGTAVIEKLGPTSVRKEIASGRHLTTLAFSESGSRSHFWAPVSSAKKVANGIQLDAQKSFATSASQADSYVWSSRPLGRKGCRRCGSCVAIRPESSPVGTRGWGSGGTTRRRYAPRPP
jgi:alkylation response protein AidB-like acyl-CoA dehydrogenase